MRQMKKSAIKAINKSAIKSANKSETKSVNKVSNKSANKSDMRFTDKHVNRSVNIFFSKLVRRKSRGNIGDIVVMGIFVIAMMTVMTGFINCVDILQKKSEISQLAREYILIAETYGYIPEGDCDSLITELESMGVTEADISESTLIKTEFGHTVIVSIKGKINDKYEITEKRTSTAKY